MTSFAVSVRPVRSEQSSPKVTNARFDFLLVLPFIGLLFVQIAHHQMWRDELNAWGIAAASSNLKSLFSYIRYEGHPGLWYLLLWAASRLTNSPVAMQILQAAIGVAIYLAIAFRSPFSQLEKVLLYAGYFVSFEYTVMSRMYGVCLLLTLLYVWRRSTHSEQWVANVALLALIANTDVTGVILSGALLMEYAASTYFREKRLPSSRTFAGALGVYALGLLACALALQISPHISWRTTGRMFAFAHDHRHLCQAIISYIAVPWLPINNYFPDHFWNPWILHPLEHPYVRYAAPVVVTAIGWIFRRNWIYFVTWLLTAAGAIAFGHLVYMGGTRHYGLTFTAFLACYWMMRQAGARRSIVAIILFGASAMGGAFAAYGEWHHPFSNGRAAASWLHDNHLDRMPMVGTPDTSVIGVAEQMRRPIYMLDCNCTNTFLLFNNQRDDFQPEQTPERLQFAAEKLHASDFILLMTYPLPPDRLQQVEGKGFTVNLLQQFTGAEDLEENYFIYRVTKSGT